MFFDLDEEGRENIRQAFRHRDPDVAPIEALRLLAHRIIAERRPYIRFFEGSRKFMETISASETLKARARAIRDELTDIVRKALVEAVGRDRDDPDAHLAASLLLTAWAVAFIEAHRTFSRNNDVEEAQNVFLNVVDRGTNGVKVVAVGTPYA